jgi:hypothetical protein
MPLTDTWPYRAVRTCGFNLKGVPQIRVGLVARRPLDRLTEALSTHEGYVRVRLGGSPCQLSQLLLHHNRSDEKAKKTFPQGHFRLAGHSG